MRLRSSAVALLVSASWACGGSSSSPDPYEGGTEALVGWWIGTQTATRDGLPTAPSMVAMEITSGGAGLLLGGACPDGSAARAVATGPASFSVPRHSCPVATVAGCTTTTMEWSHGSATIDRGLLSLTMTGTLSGCGNSVAISMTLDALRDALPPELTAILPTSAVAGTQGIALTVAGRGFAPKAVVRVGGSAVPTTFVSETELTASLPPAALASASETYVTVTNIDAQGSLPLPFEVRNPVPAITAIAPTTIAAGTPGATVTVNGTGFVATSQAACGGNPRFTTYVGPTRVMVALTSEDLAYGSDKAITVSNGAPGGGTSEAVQFHVLNPAPLPAEVYPSSLPTGGARSFVTVSGSAFVPGATIYWNGAPRRTHFASSTHLSAEVLASDLSADGTAALSVENPAPGGGTAAVGPITIAPPAAASSRSVAYQFDPAHSGRASVGGAVTFPTNRTWSVALPDLVSYPLVADGKTFLLVRGSGTSGYGTRLVALDLATGVTAWGPVAVQGTYYWAGHAYDAGRIYVVNFDGDLSAFDATTGASAWSVHLPGQYAFSAPPTAADGVVYLGGAGSGGTVYAVDGSDGTILWTRSVANGDHSSPAVTADAVYVSYPCQVYKFDRRTGDPLWHLQQGCSGGGGKTAAYSAGSLYVRDYGFGVPFGAIYDAFDGAPTGTFGTTGYLPIPALDGDARFVLVGSSLERWEAGATQASWSFTGDGQLASAPIVVGDAVVVGSSSGTVFAVDSITGLERWSDDAGAPVLGPDEQNVSRPLTGLAAGDGYLVVPASNRVSAWRVVAP